MPECYTSVYQIARKTTRLTQERAAEALNVSVETIKAWEGGLRVPAPDMVGRMTQLYETPWLAAVHLLEISRPLDVLPDICIQALPTAVIQLINRVFAFADCHRDRQLLQIAEDGIIDEAERPLFDEITQELQGIIAAALQVIYPYEDKKRTAPMVTHRSGSVQGALTDTENDCKNNISQSRRKCKDSQQKREGESA